MSQVVLITGCSRGLGRLLAERLASGGATVYAGLRKPLALKELRSVWKDVCPSIRPVKLDITSNNDCRRVVKKIIAEAGRLDGLINNAGYGLSGPTVDFSVQDFLNILNTNAIGAFRLIREAVPCMRAQGGGRIVNVTSLNGLLALPNFGLYCASKFAVEALGLSLRYELKGDNIWVTNVAPGAIASQEKFVKNPTHVPAREKFWLVKKLMPMVTQEEVVGNIERLLDEPRPPARVLLGCDAQITSFLHRFLPQKLWDWLLSFIWQR